MEAKLLLRNFGNTANFYIVEMPKSRTNIRFECRSEINDAKINLSIYIYIKYAGQVGKSPLGRPRRRWVDNIKMDLGEIGWDGMDWIDVAQDRDQWRALVNMVMNLRVP
jgi:hypothetical protein